MDRREPHLRLRSLSDHLFPEMASASSLDTVEIPVDSRDDQWSVGSHDRCCLLVGTVNGYIDYRVLVHVAKCETSGHNELSRLETL